jgi:hypothetical protein
MAVGLLCSAWIVTVAITLVCMWLIINGSWMWCALFVACIVCLNTIQHRNLPVFFRRFFLDGVAEAVGGVTIVKSEKCLDGPSAGNQRTLYAIQPHGLTATGVGFALSDAERRTGTRVALAVAPFLRWTNPVMRFIMGCIGVDLISSSSEAIRSVMRTHKQSVGIVVGGFDEMLQTKSDTDTVYLSRRKGFLKLAVRKGYSVTPVYCFGECALYSNALSLPSKLSAWLARWKIPAIWPVGRSRLDYMPKRLDKGLVVVFGPTIKFEKSNHPGREYIDRIHTEYSKAVVELYEKYNPYPHRPLEIL